MNSENIPAKKLIATHDSATGEKPTWWSALLTPFARTQGKLIGEQFACGASLYDIRIKKVFGVWRCAHGWWFTRRTAADIMSELDFYAKCGYDIRVMITYEGRVQNAAEFVEYVKQLKAQFPSVRYGAAYAKYGRDANGLKVVYSEPLIPADKDWCPYPTEQAFLPLDGRSWHTYIPLPWLWKMLYFRHVEFDDKVYRFVDFL